MESQPPGLSTSALKAGKPYYIGCSAGYKLSTYPQFETVNSQVVEQSNSMANRIKSSVSYMNSSNFMMHCKLFYWYHNKLQKKF